MDDEIKLKEFTVFSLQCSAEVGLKQAEHRNGGPLKTENCKLKTPSNATYNYQESC